MTEQANPQNRQIQGYRDLRSEEIGPDGAALVRPKRLGRYQIVAELGRGAMGAVYEAHDPRIDRVVAIKIITVSAAGPREKREYRSRFIREARAAGRLTHPGIVTIYDVDEDPASHTPYIAMEFVPGKRLDTLVADLPGQRLLLEKSLALAQQIAEALDYAHSQGIVHRDIKPGNVIVTEEGRAKIADFGIAKINLTEFTMPGQVLGTPAFMAPEQLREGTADGRSDLFSLGVILYWMLTGEKPFRGDSATSIAFKLAFEDPTQVTEISPNLHPHFNAVLGRALAKAPAARYQTGKEFALDLKLLSEKKTPRAVDVSSASRKAGMSALAALGSVSLTLRSMMLLVFSAIRTWLTPLLAVNRTWLKQLRAVKWREHVWGWDLSRGWDLLRGWGLSRGRNLKWRVVAGAAAVLVITAVGFRFAIGRRRAAGAGSPNSPVSAMRPIASPVPALPPPPPVIANRKPARSRTNVQLSASKHDQANLAPAKNAVSAAPKVAAISTAEMAAKPEPVASFLRDTIPEPGVKVQSARATLLTVGKHPFHSATLSISVDGELANEEQLTGTRKLLFGPAHGTISESIRLAPGQHVVEVRMVSERDHYDQAQTIEGQFPANEVKELEIEFVARVLRLSWK
jgi:serine/threonine protein kinase